MPSARDSHAGRRVTQRTLGDTLGASFCGHGDFRHDGEQEDFSGGWALQTARDVRVGFFDQLILLQQEKVNR